MELIPFCEWLIYMEVIEKDYSASMTLNGISHFCHIARQRAIKDKDWEEYDKYREIGDFIYNHRNLVRAQFKAEIVSAAK